MTSPMDGFRPEEHPRDSHGRFRDKWGVSGAAKALIDRILNAFKPATFRSDDHAQSYLDSIAGKKKRSPRQAASLDYFTSDGWGDIQSSLRAGNDDGPQIADLDAMMEPLPHDVLLTRVVGADAFGLTPETIGQVEEWTGKLVSDKAFAPSNIGTPLQVEGPHVTISFVAPRGTRAVVPGGSREVILDREQPFRIMKVEPDGHGGVYVYAVVQPKQGAGVPRGLGKELAPSEIAPAVEATPEEIAKRTPGTAVPAAPATRTPLPAPAPQAQPVSPRPRDTTRDQQVQDLRAERDQVGSKVPDRRPTVQAPAAAVAKRRQQLGTLLGQGQPVDWNKKIVKDLRAEAKKRGLKIPTGSRKADIVKLLENDDKGVKPTSPATKKTAKTAVKAPAKIAKKAPATPAKVPVGARVIPRDIEVGDAIVIRTRDVDAQGKVGPEQVKEVKVARIEKRRGRNAGYRFFDDNDDLIITVSSNGKQEIRRKKATPSTAERQAEAKRLQGAAAMSAQIEQLVENGGSTRALRHTANSKRFDVSDEDRAKLLAAIDTGDSGKIKAAIEDLRKGHGLRVIGGRAGEVTRFDRNKHESIGQPIDDGQAVVVVRAGHEVDSISGETVIVDRAAVQRTDQAPSTPAKKAPAKKVAPPKPPRPKPPEDSAQVTPRQVREGDSLFVKQDDGSFKEFKVAKIERTGTGPYVLRDDKGNEISVPPSRKVQHRQRPLDGLDDSSDYELTGIALDYQDEIPEIKHSFRMDILEKISREELIRRLRALGAVSHKRRSAITEQRNGLNDQIDLLGRKRPDADEILDRAAKALADGVEPRKVGDQIRRETALKSGLSSEDRTTLTALATDIKSIKVRPAYITPSGTIDLKHFLQEAGLTEIGSFGTAPTITAMPSRKHSYAYYRIRDDLLSGKIGKAKALKALRDAVDSTARSVVSAKNRKASYGRGAVTDWEDAIIADAPDAIKAYTALIDALEKAKIPPKKRQASLGFTEVGDVLPIDESTFVPTNIREGGVTHRGVALNPKFTHKGFLPFQVPDPPKRDGLTDDENKALDLYLSGTVARALNGSLRKGRTVHGTLPDTGIPGVPKDLDLDHMRRDMDTAIEAGALEQDTELWRGVLLKAPDRARLQPGFILTELGYSSTSADRTQAERMVDYWKSKGLYRGTKPAYFKILARRGQHAAVGHASLEELILPRGQAFRVVREEVGKDGAPVFVLEVVDSRDAAGIVRGRDLLTDYDFGDLPKSGWSIDHGEVRRGIVETQGFDGLPGVLTRQEMDLEVRRGAVEVWRGVKPTASKTGAEIVEEYRTGPMYYGTTGGTLYGTGTYSAAGEAGARSYANSWMQDRKGAVVRMAVRRGARVISYSDIRKLHVKSMPKALQDLDARERAELDAIPATDTDAIQKIIDKYRGLRSKMSSRSQAMADLGNFATLLGYDVIRVPAATAGGVDYYVILNRTAMLVEEEDR